MKKSKWLGSLLNFVVPGLGHYYSRKRKKAIVTYVMFFLVALSLRFFAYNFPLFIISASIIVAAYLYLIISGYRDVEKTRDYDPNRFDKWYVYAGIFILHVTFLEVFRGRPLDRITPINFAKIPTPAMDPTLKIGDRLAFTKTNAPDRGDIVIFWFPGHEPWQSQANTLYIKRCIALPGDSLQIRSSNVFLNNDPEEKRTLKFKHLVTTNGSSINGRVLEEHGLSQSDYLQISSDTYVFYLTEEEATKLRELKFLKEVNISIASREQGEAMIYPPSMSLPWNPDFYGPIYVPKRGDKIDLTERSIDLYWNCIAFESNSAKRDASGVLIDGKRLETYEFKEDYFFMMGDNRHNSLDSRYWGLLPGSLVIGKAKYIYWGKTIDRIGKEII